MKLSILSNRFIGYALALGLMGAPFTAQASTVSTFDVLVATDNLTVIGTATVQGNAFSVGTSTFVVQQGRIGIGTATLTQQLQIVGIQPSGDDYTQLIWFSTRGALRAGGKNLLPPDPWSTDRIGLYSVAFGLDNEASGDRAFVGSGAGNVARAANSAIGGGGGNSTDGSYAVIGGGSSNDTTDSAATVGGGFLNLATNFATVGGGYLNIASAQYATIPGGRYNIASGTDSFAAGYNASAEGTGSFVWADAGGPQFRSTINNEFKARANGGFVLVGGAGAPTIIVSSGAVMISTSATAASAVPNIFISSTNGNVGIGKNSPATTLDVNGAITASSSTFTATGNNIYSLTSSSGIHILAGGITWADNTTSTTATPGGGSGGNASLASTQTFTGANTFTGTTTFGGSSQAQEQAMPSILARSFDGATQSSGCLVALAMESPGGLGATSTSRIVFTSTTTVSAVGMLGVLLETCAPGSDCRIAITGLVRVKARPACASGNHGAAIMSTWSTRCETSCGVAALGNGIVGTVLSDNWSSGWAWFWMR